MKAPLAALSIAVLIPVGAQAQIPLEPPRYGLEASRQHSPGGRTPLIAYSREVSGRWITEFYAMSRLDGESEPVVFARRALDSYDGQEQIRWADSRVCPGMIPQLLRANRFPLPSVLIPLDEASRAQRAAIGPPSPPAADGPGPYVFWAMTFGAGHEARFWTYGGPWHDWANQMEHTLKHCWGDEIPTVGRQRGS